MLRRIDSEPHVLLIRDPYGKWGLPKGHLEPGERKVDAAEREVREETGLEALEHGPEIATIDWYFRRGGRLVHKFCTFYLMKSQAGEATPQVEEGITECVWVPLVEAIDRIAYSNASEVVAEAGRRLHDGTSQAAG